MQINRDVIAHCEPLEFTATVPLPVSGWQLGIRTASDVLVAVDFVRAAQRILPQTLLAQSVAEQLERYLEDPKWKFSLPLATQGTAFQERVWSELRKLRAGEFKSYGTLARQMFTSARAVGGACRANPIAVIIPCHRIIAQQGLGGFSGKTSGDELAIKQWLLEHESKN